MGYGWGFKLRGLSGMGEAFHTYLLALPSRSVRIASRRSQERPAKTRDIVSGLKFARQVYIPARRNYSESLLGPLRHVKPLGHKHASDGAPAAFLTGRVGGCGFAARFECQLRAICRDLKYSRQPGRIRVLLAVDLHS